MVKKHHGISAAGWWDACYNYIGHCHMFLNLLKESNPTGATEEDKKRWKAEAEFLKAYYHFRLLEMYGPIPIVDDRMPQSTLPEDFPGRSHFDYVIDYIVNQKLNEETINALPDVGKADDWGRATKSAEDVHYYMRLLPCGTVNFHIQTGKILTMKLRDMVMSW